MRSLLNAFYFRLKKFLVWSWYLLWFDDIKERVFNAFFLNLLNRFELWQWQWKISKEKFQKKAGWKRLNSQFKMRIPGGAGAGE